MNLSSLAESAEQEFRPALEKFFIAVYNDGCPSSHDIEHHRRVWKYAKELLPHYKEIPLPEVNDLPKKLIIACFLHDIGMSVDTGVRHGHHGRKFCKHFLKEIHLKETDFRDVLSAVEYHDKKEYSSTTGKNDVLNILSVADDLDAFGYIGIYRYSEIYLLRGTDPTQIGYLIRENAAIRFENFKSLFGEHLNLYNRHRKRYLILDGFFEIYNQEIKIYNFGDSDPAGHCGIIEILSNHIRDKKSAIELMTNYQQLSRDILINNFFSSLKSETTL
jgi:HD superfamily phosphodiesterase